MSIMRHEIRQISEENRGQPIISQAVVHGNVAYLAAGITPRPECRRYQNPDRSSAATRSMSFSRSREPTNHVY